MTALTDPGLLFLGDLPTVRALIAHLRAMAEPTSCCGRGCNGCVWEGFYEALHHWRVWRSAKKHQGSANQISLRRKNQGVNGAL